jgi:8-oxo-dGTP diphosphatase
MIEVTAAVIERDGLVLICRRRSAGKFGGLLEFPGGKTEPGEDPPTALRREIWEELGLEIVVGRPLGRFPYREPSFAIDLAAFRASSPSGADVRLNDHQEARWVRPGELGAFEFAPADRPLVDLLLRDGQS